MQPTYPVHIGIDETRREAIASGLGKVLADSYTLYLQTHNFHWNVTGPHFRDLHLLFEEQYTELSTAVDEIAERIRTLGFPAPGTYKAFLSLTRIREVDGIPEAFEMVKILAEGNEAVVRACRETLPLTQEAGDESSSALLSDRMRLHEKSAWMLRSLL